LQGQFLTWRRRRRRQKAQKQAKTAVSGNSSRPNLNDRHNLSRDVPTGADNLITTQFIRLYIGPRYSLCTLTIGNTYVCLLIYHYSTVHHL
jgi:hypothetical protein